MTGHNSRLNSNCTVGCLYSGIGIHTLDQLKETFLHFWDGILDLAPREIEGCPFRKYGCGCQ